MYSTGTHCFLNYREQTSHEYNFVFIAIINELRIKKAMNQTQMLFCLRSVSIDLHSPTHHLSRPLVSG